MLEIMPERAGDGVEIATLLDAAFGKDRFAKTSYRFRGGVEEMANLSWTARSPTGLVGTIRYWPVRVGGDGMAALLLGPLAVCPRLHGRGIGRRLVAHSLELAKAEGHRLVLLVGDGDYYEPFGFRPACEMGLTMAGEPKRLLALDLNGLFMPQPGPVMPWI